MDSKYVTEHELLDLLTAQVEASSQVEVARSLEVSPTYLNMILHAKRAIGDRMAEALGVERLVVFRMIDGL